MGTFLIANSGIGSIFVLAAAKPPDTGWFLLHYGTDGNFKGDTWHASIDDARSQAQFESPRLSDSDWMQVTGTLTEALVQAGAEVSGLALDWFAVRCVFHHAPRATYEERITLWQATSVDAALQEAEREAIDYAQNLDHVRYLGLAQAFHLFEPPGNGAEVFTLMRDSTLPPDDYLTRHFDTGAERQRRYDSHP